MARDRKYGVNTLIKEVHVNAVDFDENFRKPEYQYIVEVVEIYDHNGNGNENMKIYTDGVLDIFNVGNWKISPVINMPYNWTGYSAQIEMSDLNSNIYTKNGRPDVATSPGKINFVIDIKWVFETIKSMENIEDCEHFELLDYIVETDRLFNLYKTSSVSLKKFNELLQRLDFQRNKYNSIKDRLKSVNVSILNIRINESIKIFNTITLNDVEKW